MENMTSVSGFQFCTTNQHYESKINFDLKLKVEDNLVKTF